MSVHKPTLEMQADQIEAVLARHKVQAIVRGGVVTPRFVQFRLRLAVGMKVNKISSLAEEIALALGQREARIFRKGGEIGIEIPRESSDPVRLLPLCKRISSVPPGTCVLGLEDDGTPLLVKITSPDVSHILIAGTTGSGKTGLARTVLTSMAVYNSPSKLKIRLIDPKRRGFAPLLDLPNVEGSIASTPEIARQVLLQTLNDMETRDLQGVSDPRIVVAVDELADLLQTGGKEVEAMLTRISQRGRESGIHLISCTQKPTASLIGSTMKANFPIRLVGLVASKEEARYATGLTNSGAEKLEGRGDFLLVSHGRAIRFQSAWTGPTDLRQIIKLLQQNGPVSDGWPSEAQDVRRRSRISNFHRHSPWGRLLAKVTG